jgi:hypothetical protein
MTFTFRSIAEFIFGLGMVVAAIMIKMNQVQASSLMDLSLTLLSLGGILVLAHAIWLARRRAVS